MTVLHQQPVSAFEVYEPSESEKAKGRWAVVHEKWIDGEPDWNSIAHIMPTFGQHHQISENCWCQPKRFGENNDIIHEASQ
jgi:hypothetical protein